jgi:tetratricopeptide (TPR) repeat protein
MKKLPTEEKAMRGKLLPPGRLMLMGCLFLSISFPTYPQASHGITVSGKVSLPDSNPAAQILINISGTNGFSASTNTDDVGNFRFEGIPRSIYSLTATIPKNMRYRAEPLSVDTTREGSNFTANIFLRNPMEDSGEKEKKAQVISTKEANQNIPRDARKALDKAKKLREQKKFDAALAELDKAVRIFPEYFQAFTEKGTVQIQSGHTQEALQDFNRAIQIFPEHEPALSGAGYCLLTLEKYQQSIDLLERAVHLDSTHTQNLLFLGIANLALSRWQKAQEALEQALKLDAAGAVSARIYLAEAFAGQHLYSRAADELHTYLQLNPGVPNADRLQKKEKYWRAQIAKSN